MFFLLFSYENPPCEMRIRKASTALHFTTKKTLYHFVDVAANIKYLCTVSDLWLRIVSTTNNLSLVVFLKNWNKIILTGFSRSFHSSMNLVTNPLVRGHWQDVQDAHSIGCKYKNIARTNVLCLRRCYVLDPWLQPLQTNDSINILIMRQPCMASWTGSNLYTKCR